ncbi:uncharacterized protein N7459_007153 [Penicillium hispanicum]|uniref:uncharacterized protein n=1 Tax=Penicillium hispanicum TaxID=1080232 RepID=UPI002541A267|nr:uncharacterized protein N7459_007153 [Penicillium hispanicum]KAJ5578189.1 hypothetical protein N7459_007153 [Penicillium hispanicum]
MASEESKSFLYDVLESFAGAPPRLATEDLSPTPSGSTRWRTWVFCPLAAIVKLGQLGLIVAQYLAQPDKAIQCQHVSWTYLRKAGRVMVPVATRYSPAKGTLQQWETALQADKSSYTPTGTLIRISEEEMSHLERGKPTTLERDWVIHLHNGGYATGLGVSHDLHCLVSYIVPHEPSSAWPGIDRDIRNASPNTSSWTTITSAPTKPKRTSCSTNRTLHRRAPSNPPLPPRYLGDDAKIGQNDDHQTSHRR